MTGTTTAGDDGGVVVDVDTWPTALVPDVDAGSLSAVDREIIFGALVEFAEDEGSQLLEVEVGADRSAVSADAPFLVPGTRVHVRAGDLPRAVVQRALAIATSYVLSGSDDPLPSLGGLGVGVMVDVFNLASRLDRVEAEIVRALIDLRTDAAGALPSEDDLRKALPDADDLPQRLASLAERGVVAREENRWRVAF